MEKLINWKVIALRVEQGRTIAVLSGVKNWEVDPVEFHDFRDVTDNPEIQVGYSFEEPPC